MTQINVNVRTDDECANAETKTAMDELQMMKKDSSSYKGYTDVDEMMKELCS